MMPFTYNTRCLSARWLVSFGVSLLILIVSLQSAAEESGASPQQRGLNRLKFDESLLLETYATTPPQPLEKTGAQYDVLRGKKNLNLSPLPLNSMPENRQSTPRPAALAGMGDAVTTQPLTIVDVRAKALKNNLTLQVAQLDPRIAATEVRQEEAKFDQIIFAYAKYSELDTPKMSGDSVVFTSTGLLNDQKAKISTLEQVKRSTTLEAGVKIPLRTGGVVAISSPLENKVGRSQFNSDEYRAALRFSISQPLLRNAGRDVNEASIRIAEFGAQAVQLETRLQSIRIVALVDKAYWALYQAWGELDVRRQQFELASQNLDMVKKRVAEGLSAAIEVNRAEIGVADRLDALITAETNVKLAQRRLRVLMNDLDEEAQSAFIVPSTDPNLLKYEFDRKKLLEDALQGRLELLEQELKLAQDATKIEYLKNQTLPLFSLDYEYGALSNTQNSFGNVYQHMLNGQFNDWSIGLKFEMPFSNGVRKEQLERAVLQRNQRLATKELQTLTVKKEIYDAVDVVEQNWQRILAARQQVLIAGLNYEAELKQFNEGLRTMTEVLETLTRIADAQIKEIRAVSDYQVSLIDTAYATGTLLGYSKLDFDMLAVGN